MSSVVRRARNLARKLLPEPNYRAASVDDLVAQVGRVRVRCDIAGIGGWLTLRERQILYALARSLTGPFAEVGSWVGLSTCIICAGIRDSGEPKEFVTHELNPSLDDFKPHGDGIGFFPLGATEPMGICTVEDYEQGIKPVLQQPGGAVAELRRNLASRGLSEMVRIVEGDFGLVESRAYRFVFADVLHDLREMRTNGPKVARLTGHGTILACHDFNAGHEALLQEQVRFRKVGLLDSMLVGVVSNS